MIDGEGQYMCWKDAVPDGHCSPFISLDEIDKIADREMDNISPVVAASDAEEEGLEVWPRQCTQGCCVFTIATLRIALVAYAEFHRGGPGRFCSGL